ncbi:MAG: hypothetical protein SF028_07465 [Candidatus Sumerlaeia bacterium]|nr:hypothetical protein [Candidatus Sumerlaeia bacterium]
MSGSSPVARVVRLLGVLLVALVLVARAVPPACCMEPEQQKAACCGACPSERTGDAPDFPSDCPPTCIAAADDFLPPALGMGAVASKPPAQSPRAALVDPRPDRIEPSSGLCVSARPPSCARVRIHLWNRVLRR